MSSGCSVASRPANDNSPINNHVVRLASTVATKEVTAETAADYYACLHVGARTHLLRRSMSELEEDLDPARFCRIHRIERSNPPRGA